MDSFSRLRAKRKVIKIQKNIKKLLTQNSFDKKLIINLQFAFQQLSTLIIKLFLTSKHQMGSSLNKDEDVQLFMTLNKPMFYAGQYAEGMVHINCLNSRPYHSLNIVINGSEQCWWKNNHLSQESNSLSNAGSRVTYLAEISLAKFDSGLKKGQYNFPFSILLPRAMPASIFLDKFNYIKYQISAVIPAYDHKNSPQIYKRSLHIRQPPRDKPHSLESTDTRRTTCCGCDCGFMILTLKSDTNFLENNRAFPLSGIINNTNGEIQIVNYKILLRQVIQKVSNQFNKYIIQNNIVLHDAKKSIQTGKVQQFNVQVTTPFGFQGYTAIGNIISRVYYLTLVVQIGLCVQDQTVGLHSVLISRIAPIPTADQIKNPPNNWKPNIAAPVTFVDLPPYIYSPSPLLSLKNQEKRVAMNDILQQIPTRPNKILCEQIY